MKDLAEDSPVVQEHGISVEYVERLFGLFNVSKKPFARYEGIWRQHSETGELYKVVLKIGSSNNIQALLTTKKDGLEVIVGMLNSEEDRVSLHVHTEEFGLIPVSLNSPDHTESDQIHNFKGLLDLYMQGIH